VVDPQLSDPLGESLEVRDALARRSLRRVLVPRIHPDVDPSRSPYLLHADSEAAVERVVNLSIRVAAQEICGGFDGNYRARSMCAWIPGEKEPQALARRLSNCARVVRPSGEAWPLRLWDPRVIAHLPRVLTTSQWNTVRQIAPCWYAFDLYKQFSDAMTRVQIQEAVPETSPFNLNLKTWEALERVGAVNQVMSLAANWQISTDLLSAEHVDSLVKRCLDLGLDSQQDVLVFAAAALTSHERFDEHPAVRTSIDRARQNGQSLEETMALIPDSLWDQISTGKWLTESANTH
jgi:hypothetical protein